MPDPDLFAEVDPPAPEPVKPPVVERRSVRPPATAKPERAILSRLEKGRTPSTTLAAITSHYTKRISNLRRQGHDIRLVNFERFSNASVTVYALYVDGKEVGS